MQYSSYDRQGLMNHLSLNSVAYLELLRYMTQIARTIKQRHPNTPVIVFPKGAHYALNDLKAAGVFDVIGRSQ